MRERKHVKFRVDMYDDTKFKIIDMKPERDLIHYIWTRLVTLAGKVNLDGDLYMSKNLPYTIETLAIEFNRGIDQIKLALNVLIELEMIEFNEENIYSVKNFSKHQNIKAKEKIKSNDNKEIAKNEKIQENESNKEIKSKENLIISIENEDLKNEIYDNGNLKSEANFHSQEHIPILLETKKNKKVSKKKKKESNIDTIDEKNEDKSMFCIYEDNEERPLGEGESIVSVWAF